jgi:hypothetical protein
MSEFVTLLVDSRAVCFYIFFFLFDFAGGGLHCRWRIECKVD